ncbi:hypothetical protein KRR39_19125 [Nocardioides panacis]|uniref:Uncharacterized protein n=1 Tax=Nocardioides panacis TaxID=2849501 RepID=A0A975XZL5_9ACTN|nr:hypothetical protein [Nocardioides panacis]QWZ07523.1 hypothetical protein KRR39_19125 [Nocardioides panacis]
MNAHDTDHEDLRARFGEVVDGAGLDLDRLAGGARRRGGRIRRRRRLLAVAGTGAAVAAVVGGLALTGTGSTASAPPVATGSTAPTAPTGTPSPVPTAAPSPAGLVVPEGQAVAVTGRSTAAALLDLVGQLVPGRASDVGGQGQPPARPEDGAAAQTYATFTWTPAAGGAGTQVMVNVQNAFGGAGPDQAGRPFFSCRDDRVACTVDRADGLLVVSYERHRGAAVDRVVDVYHRDTGLRVVVASTNADEVEKGRPVREDPPLSSADLRDIATLDAWGATLPRPWDQAGAALSPYHDYDAEQP